MTFTPKRNSRLFPAALVAGLGASLLGTGCRSGDDGIGVPSAIVLVSGGNQEASVGTGVAASPVVRVQDGSGTVIAGVTVRFTIVNGGGTLFGDSTVTDANGQAKVGGWILGTLPGVNTLRAAIPSTTLTTDISATAVVGGGVTLQGSSPQAYVALINQTVTPAPAVRVLDSFGNPVPDIAVTFSVQQGGGLIVGGQALTNSSGVATIGSWTVGPTAGTNLLTASISSGPLVSFSAAALTQAPVLSPISPTSQDGYRSFPVTTVPRVQVTDGSGHILSGVPVNFAVVTGDATVTGGLAVSDANGVAAPTDWRLGLTPSATLSATAGLGASPVAFTASGSPANFVVDVRFLTTMSPDVRDAFVAAARRWMGIITAHLTSVTVNLPAATCSTKQPALNEVITDVVIFAEVTPIDGVGQILGSAGPCAVRSSSELPLVGAMQFDVADMDSLVATHQIVPTITHEMAHVLGFGTIWSSHAVTSGIGGSDPVFIGPAALALWPAFAAGLGLPLDVGVPLENCHGAGTRDVHWRENVSCLPLAAPAFGAELMTGFIEAPGVPMPLSKMTIASMQDLGYSVDLNQADPFAGNLLARGARVRPPTLLNERLTSPRYVISPLGLIERRP